MTRRFSTILCFSFAYPPPPKRYVWSPTSGFETRLKAKCVESRKVSEVFDSEGKIAFE